MSSSPSARQIADPMREIWAPQRATSSFKYMIAGSGLDVRAAARPLAQMPKAEAQRRSGPKQTSVTTRTGRLRSRS